MAKAYYSTVLDHSAEDVWSVIRPFDHYGWAGVPGETVMEGGRSGDQVGSIRRFTIAGRTQRQVLLAHSDLDRAYSYAFVGEPSLPARNYVATLRVTRVVDTGRAFVEWWATFDCSRDDYGSLMDRLTNEGFAVWLTALRHFMNEAKAAS